MTDTGEEFARPVDFSRSADPGPAGSAQQLQGAGGTWNSAHRPLGHAQPVEPEEEE